MTAEPDDARRSRVAGAVVHVMFAGVLLLGAGVLALMALAYGTLWAGPDFNGRRSLGSEDVRLGAGLALAAAVVWAACAFGAARLTGRRAWSAAAVLGTVALLTAAWVILTGPVQRQEGPRPGEWPGVPKGFVSGLLMPTSWPALAAGVVAAVRRRPLPPLTAGRAGPPPAGLVAALVAGAALLPLGPARALESPEHALTVTGHLFAVGVLTAVLGTAIRVRPALLLGLALVGAAVLVAVYAVVSTATSSPPPGPVFPPFADSEVGAWYGIRRGLTHPAAWPLGAAVILGVGAALAGAWPATTSRGRRAGAASGSRRR